MIEHSKKTTAGTTVLVALALPLLLSIGISQSRAQSVSAPKIVVPNFEASCRADVLQAVAAKLPGVTVKNVKDAPKFQDGVKYFAASGKVPAFCEVSGSFVTDTKTGRILQLSRCASGDVEQ
jgi:feruloyl esterase